jgi:hypothetical protein
MGKHAPESAQCLSRNLEAKLRDVSLKKSSDIIFSPLKTGFIVVREDAAGVSASQPVGVCNDERNFRAGERGYFNIGYPAGQRF